MTEALQVAGAVAQDPKGRTAHPIRSLLISRLLTGVVSVFVISIVVYAATLVLPGDAATAILGQQATPQRLADLRHQLHLDQSPISGYLSWAKARSARRLRHIADAGYASVGHRRATPGQLDCAGFGHRDHLDDSRSAARYVGCRAPRLVD